MARSLGWVMCGLCLMPLAEADESMGGMLGHDPMMRESTGTSWQPDDSVMEGYHDMGDTWMSMAHATLTLADTQVSGPRGASQSFNDSMFMWNAWRSLGVDTLALKTMLSAELLNGAAGEPLLYQTGETADGIHALVDRQHPHNLVMELAASFSHPLSDNSAVFVYGGPAGEPALGPSAFMHRLASMDNPEAPITHHWMDSTHISYGVITLGWDLWRFRLEGSQFNGREPDQHRADVEIYPLDSSSLRLSYNPTEHWSMQISRGYIAHPETLDPSVSVHRSTASVTYARAGEWGRVDVVTAVGRNQPTRGDTTNGILTDADWRFGSHSLYARYEQVTKDELFANSLNPPVTSALIVKKSLGFSEHLATFGPIEWRLGAVVSGFNQPVALNPYYGSDPHSWTVYTRFNWIH